MSGLITKNCISLAKYQLHAIHCEYNFILLMHTSNPFGSLKFSLFYLARIVTWIAVKVFMTSPIIWSRIPMITKMRNDFKMVAFEQLKSEIT
jgi:hypothetical protein